MCASYSAPQIQGIPEPNVLPLHHPGIRNAATSGPNLREETGSNRVETSSLCLVQAINGFHDYIRLERRLAKTTVSGYNSWIKVFVQWLRNNGYPSPTLSTFNPMVLKRYLQYQSEQGKRPRSMRSLFAPLRSFGNWLVDNEYLPDNPVRKVILPKMDAAKRDLVSDSEVALLLDACEKQKDRKKIALSRAILSVLIYGGLRRQELLDLSIGDVNIHDGGILVRAGKGSKSRKIYVCQDCREALGEWLAIRPESDCLSLWVHGPKRPIHENGLVSLIETVKAIAGLKDNSAITPHALRHNCATRLLRNGADLGQISAFLGHSSLLTTQMYLHTSEEDLRDIASLTAMQPPISSDSVRDTSARRVNPTEVSNARTNNPGVLDRKVERRDAYWRRRIL